MSNCYAIVNLIKMPPGFVVAMKDLCVYRDGGGKYKVSYSPESGDKIDEEFDSVFDAVKFFSRKREELKLGFDF